MLPYFDETLRNHFYNVLIEKEKMRREMEAEIRANLALNQEAMQSWDEKVK